MIFRFEQIIFNRTTLIYFTTLKCTTLLKEEGGRGEVYSIELYKFILQHY
jgi:hypothetical protein